ARSCAATRTGTRRWRWRWAGRGPAIIASAATVILSLLCLLVAELNSTKSLGPVMAIGIAVGLCAMVTLLPALLVIFGRWVFWPRRPDLGSAEPTERGLWARVGERMARRPRGVWVGTAGGARRAQDAGAPARRRRGGGRRRGCGPATSRPARPTPCRWWARPRPPG